MSKARGLISGGNLASRTSGMYDSADNVRLSQLSSAGLKKVGLHATNIFTTGESANSFAWSPDGLHFYLLYGGDYVKHYECTTPFNLSGASVQATWNNTTYDTGGTTIEVSPNGRYIYLGGTLRDQAQQFTMVNEWDISTETTNNLFSPGYEQQNKRLENIKTIGSGDSIVWGCEFNGDGTKFYMVGQSDDYIQQFSLSTAYNIGTASYDGYYDVGADGYGRPTAIRWNNNGTKFFLVSYGNRASWADYVVEYSVSNAYDVTSGTITEETALDIRTYEGVPSDVAFNSDGTKMFIIGTNGDEINEWSLSTGFDLSSTITHVSATALERHGDGSDVPFPASFDFNPTGTKLVVINYNVDGDDTITAYNLSTAFDSSTISDYETIDVSSSWTVSTYLTNFIDRPFGCRFNGDGTSITIMDRSTDYDDKAVSIPLTTAYELSSYSDGAINNQGHNLPTTFRFNPDGTKCYIFDGTDDLIYQWSLAKPYVLGRGSSAMTYEGTSSTFTSEIGTPRSFDFTPDGKSIYVCGFSDPRIAHYTVSVPFDVTSTLTLTSLGSPEGFDTVPAEIRVVNTFDGYKLHVLGASNDNLYEMDINF
jgi:hypothetical protein